VNVSIVIGTRNRPESLRRCLESIARQTRLPAEVLVVDDGALDPCAALAPLQGTGILGRYFNKSATPGLTKSRNLGIRESTGDVVMFLDDDVVLDRGYVEAIARVYEAHPEAAGVGGRLLGGLPSWPKRVFLRTFLLDAADDGRVLPNGIGVLIRTIDRVTRVEWFSGCNMSFRRNVFDHVMFDEDFAGNGWGDDRDFSYTVSRRRTLLAAPDATLWHLEDPRARASQRDFGAVEILYVARFFAKHMPPHWPNRLALWWSFAGILARNLVTARWAAAAGNLAGMRGVASGSGRPTP
jgi:glycosyltransferase involved in cell wall biosynthesis